MYRVAVNGRLIGRLFDIVIIFMSFHLTYFLMNHVLNREIFSFTSTHYYETYLVVVGCWVLSTFMIGEYPVRRLNGFARELTIVLRVNIVALLAFAFVSYILKLSLSRSFLAVSFIDITILMLFVRLVIRFLLGFVRAKGRDTKIQLLIGSTSATYAYLDHMEANPQLGLRVLGYLGEEKHKLPVPYLGPISGLRMVLSTHSIDGVVLALPISHPSFEQVIRECELQGVQVELMLDGISSRIAHSTLIQGAGAPRLVMDQTPHTPEGLVFKRMTDFFVSLLAVIMMSPLMLGIMIAIKLDDGGPIFFSQLRSGRCGKPFKMHKFRSMRVDAEALKAQLLHLNEMGGPVFKIKNDPRVTRVGRFLRKTSLDELPQFLDVLVGNMSLVGPRPPLPSEVSQYDAHHRRRLSVKPGITCLWQISGRNEIDFDEWVDLDLRYIDNWTYFLDLKILLQTVPAVLRKKGAS
ncbi:sugar transferase [Alicyclobacillus fodiniaquatilis]|uniref:Sugar transferase n=1 Tax=Alicyclobacillus fodiniaquatilis TaxID=1661150 RepID=A0ABW4JCS5_9BACL